MQGIKIRGMVLFEKCFDARCRILLPVSLPGRFERTEIYGRSHICPAWFHCRADMIRERNIRQRCLSGLFMLNGQIKTEQMADRLSGLYGVIIRMF